MTIMIAKSFLAYHPRAGEPTGFKEKILSGEKIHTVRGNYEYWKKVVDNVNAGRYPLVLKEWNDVPYDSNQSEITRLEKGQVGIQKVNFNFLDGPVIKVSLIEQEEYLKLDVWNRVSSNEFMKNDGFSNKDDFMAWFKYKPMTGALIYFTDFRY